MTLYAVTCTLKGEEQRLEGIEASELGAVTAALVRNSGRPVQVSRDARAEDRARVYPFRRTATRSLPGGRS